MQILTCTLLIIMYKVSCKVLRRIYTTFILGTALQKFGTRANRFGHGPLDLHDKKCSTFFNVDFLNGTPETKTAHLNLWVPALMWQRFTYDFRRASGSLSRTVQKKHGRFSSAKCNCVARCFEKAKTSVTIEGRNKIIPCNHNTAFCKLFWAVY